AFVHVDDQIGYDESGKARFRGRHLVCARSNSRESELPRGVGHHLLILIRGYVGELDLRVGNDRATGIGNGSQNEASVGRFGPSWNGGEKRGQQDKRDRNALE